jgi:hypothetical protein
MSKSPIDHPNLVRFVAPQRTNTIRLVPRAVDRSVVVRPHLPLYVLPGEEAKI